MPRSFAEPDPCSCGGLVISDPVQVGSCPSWILSGWIQGVDDAGEVAVVVVDVVGKLGASASLSVLLRNQPPTPRTRAPRIAKKTIVLKIRAFHSSSLSLKDIERSRCG